MSSNPPGVPPIYGSRMFRAFPLMLPEELRAKIRKASSRRGVSQAQYIRDAVLVALRAEPIHPQTSEPASDKLTGSESRNGLDLGTSVYPAR
jgi:hypothetical protein